jgi:DNA primase
VVQLPEGQDADGLLRSNGSPAIEGLIAGARHWLEWRFDRVLAPLSMSTGEASLETLQAVERDGKTLVEQLPEGVLRRSVEQRLEMALRGGGEQETGTLLPPVAVVDPSAATARRRAERRALRLFVHAPECRTLLHCLTFQDPACRAAMEWLGSLAVVAVDASIAGMALELAEQLQGVVGTALAQAADPGPDVIRVLQREPQGELQALLNLLEPVETSTVE